MFRFLGATTLLLAASAAFVALDYDRERRATPGLALSAYLDMQRLRLHDLFAPSADSAARTGYDLSRMVNIDAVERTSSGSAGADFFETINRSIYGTKTRPTVGVGMCRVEGGRKTCSPFAD